jgi:hypothetical protein
MVGRYYDFSGHLGKGPEARREAEGAAATQNSEGLEKVGRRYYLLGRDS